MKTLFVTFLIAGLSFAAFGQKTLANLELKHKAALQGFLAKNKNYQFLSENKITADYLKIMREDLGKSFAPYYRVADFNNDKLPDFAMILLRTGKAIDQGKEISKEHRFRYPLAIIVFNGQKNGTYENAFVEKIDAPYVSFLNLTDDKKELYFGVYETDEAFSIKPFYSYRIEYFDEP